MDTRKAIRRNLYASVLVVLAVVGAAFHWSTTAQLEGAVVAGGTVVVEGSVKKVQHASGGIVGDIRVKEGAVVAAGDLLIRLDETVTKANLAIVLNDLTAQRARLARLKAMRDGNPDPTFPDDLQRAAASNPAVFDVLDGEARLCRFILSTRREQRQQLMERVEQLRQEILGLEEQVKSTAGQAGIAQKEYDDLAPLLATGAVQRIRVTTLEREVFRHQGVLGETQARIAQSRAKISETELQTTQADHDFMADTTKEMREAETRISELSERKAAVEDQLQRLDLRAPISGTVHQLAVHTIGGVVSPSETLMLIVPSADRLIVEAHISPADIDQLSIGQETRVRFTAFNRRTTDELKGTIDRIAADLIRDPQSGQSYYVVAIGVPESELSLFGGLRLMPGMPAEVFIKTGERTLASYLLKPLVDQMQRAFRER